MQPQFKITIDPRSKAGADQRIAEMLSRIEDKGRLMPVLGEALLDATRKHFQDEESPDGAPWAKHAPLTQALRKGTSILRASGRLVGSLHYTVSGSTVVLRPGPLPYAGIHQHGGEIVAKGKALAIPFKAGFKGADGRRANKGGVIFLKKVSIPPRPYIGWGKHEQDGVRDAVEGWLEGG